ncbi:MAG: UbiX family flavin prenyltransferase [Aquificaceae bacterium]|nr:UbiX family flavin prenyltransferase [Aquificaceae bacterium]MCX7989185.1 UbiX family flavin prenyltransferase [Aquificaceae bacterium]MDW8032476.1 UbiX family flavin prenyltransferase [Aquificaceae bacterium]MDW8294252.1 UbiX family flavin prenyltransferase [Aquificaceae bacterium]
MLEKVVLCITGASGAVYGYRLLQVLTSMNLSIDLVVSSSGWVVLWQELGLRKEELLKEFPSVNQVSEKDIANPIASGSRLIEYRGVVIAPCSMSTLAHIAHGTNQNLIHRVGEVALKERVPLLLLVREAPYSQVHLENMLKVSKAGAIVLPASPGFYHRPHTLQELVDFVVGKVLDSLRIKHNLYKRWKEE